VWGANPGCAIDLEQFVSESLTQIIRGIEAAALSSTRLRAKFPMGPDGHELSFAKPAESTR